MAKKKRRRQVTTERHRTWPAAENLVAAMRDVRRLNTARKCHVRVQAELEHWTASDSELLWPYATRVLNANTAHKCHVAALLALQEMSSIVELRG